MEYEPSPDSSLSKRELRQLRTRRDLVRAVLVLLSNGGLDHFNITDLSAASKISRGTIYTYFPGGREELLQAAYDQIARDLIDKTTAATGSLLATTPQTAEGGASHPEHPPLWLATITAHAKTLFDSAGSNIGHFYHVTGPALKSKHGERGVGSGMSLQLIQDALDHAQSSGQVPATLDIPIVAVLLVGAMREASIGIAANGDDPNNVLAAFTSLVAALAAAPA